jgi:hypothetical protein
MNERAISLRTHSHAEKIKILMMMLLVCFAISTELNISFSAMRRLKTIMLTVMLKSRENSSKEINFDSSAFSSV